MQGMLWDIFCRVIDNFGDIGVCWRLSADLAARGHGVRLWVDDSRALRWMAPGALEGAWPLVEVLPWERSSHTPTLLALARADVWVEAFGCDIPHTFVAHYAQQLAIQACATTAQSAQKCVRPVWLNLEYLSAEPYVERCHGLPSPVLQGPAKGWTKFFYYPGFSAQTGGLLREPCVSASGLQRDLTPRANHLHRWGLNWQGERLVSLFCYEPPLLPAVLNELASSPEPVRLLVTPGRASAAIRGVFGEQAVLGALQINHLPHLTQADFDTLLACCDLNFVRGEDSVLRALWAGQPFVWHIYPQQDGAHGPKLEAFLEQLQFSVAVRTLHRAWNGLVTAPQDGSALLALRASGSEAWRGQVQAARRRHFNLDDLVSRLLQFVAENR
jgi:uncharacterized repeat protein (TIGR03837 family)